MDFSLFSGLGKTASQHVWKALAAFVTGVLVFLGGALLLTHPHDFGNRTSAVLSNREHTGSTRSTAPEADGGEKFEQQGPPALQGSQSENPTEKGFADSGVPAAPDTAQRAPQQEAKTSPDLSRKNTRAFSNRNTAASSTAVEPPLKNGSSTQAEAGFREMGDGAAQFSGKPDARGMGQLETTPVPAQGSTLSAPEPKPALVTLAAETPVQVRLSKTLSSKLNRTGEIFRGTLAFPLAIGGSVVAEAGATVLGRVIDAHGAGLLRTRANLNLELTDLTTTDGRSVRIHTTQWYEAEFPGKVVAKPGVTEAGNTFGAPSN